MSLKKNAGNISRLSDKRAKGGVKCENIVCELESERERAQAEDWRSWWIRKGPDKGISKINTAAPSITSASTSEQGIHGNNM